MAGDHSDLRIDPLLLPFLQAGDEREAQKHLDHLVACAGPIIQKITRSGRAPEDACQDAMQRVVKRLRELRAHPDGNAIGNYIHYVKVVSSHVVKGQVREEHPKRRSLVDSLRHILNRDPSLALWQSESRVRLCGLAAWSRQSADRPHGDRLLRLLDEPGSFEELLGRDARSLGQAELLAQLFHWVGHPIRFEELVRIVCALKRVEDLSPIVDDEEEGRTLTERLADTSPRPDEQAEWREFLERLWAEIEQLPPVQRLAYLLNFTAADGELELFWTYGIATIRRIGGALQFTEEQFARVWPELSLNIDDQRRARALKTYDDKFAFLWQHLPLSDTVIARIIGTERQKVINLRKAASDRLSRRLAPDRQA